MTATHSGDREATMDYIRPDSKMNRRYMSAGAEVSTGKYETRKVHVHDARPERDKFTLDTTGFQLVKHESKVQDWKNMQELESTYVDEIHDLVRKITGADKVVVFGPVRRTTEDKKPNSLDTTWNNQPPASDVHVDYTPIRAECLAEDFAKKNGLDRSAYKRVRFINLWRAVTPGPQNWPLAVCRGDVIDDDEGVVNHLLYVDEIPDLNAIPEKLPEDPMHAEGTLFTYRPSHDWIYFSNMSKDELLLFTLYDGRGSTNGSTRGLKKERPWRVPHCAFFNDMDGAKPRESVEIRTVCFFE